MDPKLDTGSKNFKSKLPSDRKRLLILILIVLAIPLTVGLALVQQEMRSRASGLPATPATPPIPITPTPFPPLVYKLNGITITNFQPQLSINPGTKEKLMTITSTGATTISLIGNAYGPGIYYTPSDFSISPGESVDVYMQVNSNVPNGNYSGTPIIRTDMGDGDINTMSVYLFVGIPIPSMGTPTPTPISSRSDPLNPIILTGMTVTDYTPTVSVAPGQSVKLMTINSTGGTSFCFYGPPTSLAQGINLNPASGGLVNGDSRDIYLTVFGSISPGVYSGSPKLNANCTGTLNTLPAINVYVDVPLPAPTSGPNATILRFQSIKLHGIGNGGDNTNPNIAGNLSPNKTQRTLSVELYNSSSAPMPVFTGNITYNSSGGIYTGDISIPNTIPSGSYLVKIKSPTYLKKQIFGIISINQGSITQISPISLVAGDMNNDNSLTITDYNLLTDCYSDLLPPKNCTDPNKKTSADISDDGNVNADDYNLFLRELSVVSGE